MNDLIVSGTVREWMLIVLSNVTLVVWSIGALVGMDFLTKLSTV